MLDEKLKSELLDLYVQLQEDGRMLSREKLKLYYGRFREKFGPDQLRRLDGQALLDYVQDLSNRDSLLYWMEFKNDEEFPATFGSISGGSALKYKAFRSAETGEWKGVDKSNFPVTISTDEAIAIARENRDQLIAGTELLDALPYNATLQDYERLQREMDEVAPTISRLGWGHKYLSLLYPEKLDDYHNAQYQRFYLITLLQQPPIERGRQEERFTPAWWYVQIARELDMPIYQLTHMLNRRTPKPYQYWKIGTRSGSDFTIDIWEQMRDQGFIAVGWSNLGDLSAFRDGREFEAHFKSRNPDKDKGAATRKAGEIRRFFNPGNSDYNLTLEDRVIAVHGQTVLGIGRVTGDYEYVVEDDQFPHRRAVEWLSLDTWKLPENEAPRTTFAQLKKYVDNLVAIERHILYADEQPTPGPAASVPASTSVRKVPHLEGIPGKIQSVLERKKQVILYGPPGTGKTYWAESAACDLAAYKQFDQPFAALSEEEKALILRETVRICAFHPAYGYEDFMEGYRPQALDNQMTFELRDGIFKAICKHAQKSPNLNFYLLIDEINRGDIPRIFGELLTLLETDKRGKEAVLPLSGERFSVPPNVYLIGTMNTADRSIALLDAALRRRFGFIELMPDSSTLQGALIEGIPLGTWLDMLNRQLVQYIGRDARNLQVGHAYLLENGRAITDFARLVRVLQEDILPLLEEYCYEDYAVLAQILGNTLVDREQQRIRHELFEASNRDQLIQALLAIDPEILTSIQAVKSAEEAEQAREAELEDDIDDEDEDEDR